MSVLKKYKQFWSDAKQVKVPFHYLVLNNLSELSEEEIVAAGYYPIIDEKPDFNPDVERVEETDVRSFGSYLRKMQGYKITPLSEEELLENLGKIRAEVIAKILSGADAVAAEYMSQFSDIERATWDKQEAEVVAWEADKKAKTPMLDALAEMRGIRREVMLRKAADKVALFKTMATMLIGRQQAMEDAVKSIVEDKAKTSVEKIAALRAFEVKY